MAWWVKDLALSLLWLRSLLCSIIGWGISKRHRHSQQIIIIMILKIIIILKVTYKSCWENNTVYWRKKTKPHHVPGKQRQGRCTYHSSANTCLEQTTELYMCLWRAPGCLAYGLNLNHICPLRITTDLTLVSCRYLIFDYNIYLGSIHT